MEDCYISECCFAYPAGELDMTTVKYGGPSGFCGRCWDNCIFVLEDNISPEQYIAQYNK
jgi:hypothetical protein|tara:strand:+ start:139 stop:315 length:177 start_codon:yes stop_codon:yes gene_type:complete